MLKKSLIALVLLTIISLPALATITQEETTTAGNCGSGVVRLKAEDWPVEFKWVETLLKIPVTMDVGLFLEFKNKKAVVDAGIKLKQTAIRQFTGCSIPLEIQSNFDLELGGTLYLTDAGKALQSDGGKWSVKIKDTIEGGVCSWIGTDHPKVSKTLSPIIEKRCVCVQVNEAKVFELDFGRCVKVADLVIKVRPTFEFEWKLGYVLGDSCLPNPCP
jgi:hypothetical protein